MKTPIPVDDIEEFDDDNEVIAILLRFLGHIGTDKASREASLAYKLDEAADWHNWWAENALRLSGLTSPEAGHLFRICRLKDLGVPVTSAPATSYGGRCRQPNPGVQQVLRLIPADRCSAVSA